jgi:hypothetical protein
MTLKYHSDIFAAVLDTSMRPRIHEDLQIGTTFYIDFSAPFLEYQRLGIIGDRDILRAVPRNELLARAVRPHRRRLIVECDKLPWWRMTLEAADVLTVVDVFEQIHHHLQKHVTEKEKAEAAKRIHPSQMNRSYHTRRQRYTAWSPRHEDAMLRRLFSGACFRRTSFQAAPETRH